MAFAFLIISGSARQKGLEWRFDEDIKNKANSSVQEREREQQRQHK